MGYDSKRNRKGLIDHEIIMQNFTPERLMPFIQLLIKIQGIIENETQK